MESGDIFNSEGIVFTKNCCLDRGNWSWALLQTTTMNIASFVTLIIMHFPSNVSRKCLSFLSNGFLNCFWRLVINHPHLGEWILRYLDSSNGYEKKEIMWYSYWGTPIFHHHHICKHTRISLLIQHKWQSQSVKVVTRVSDNASQSLHYKFHLLPNLIP